MTGSFGHAYSSDFSFLCMSKNCSISVIYSQSKKFIFCPIYFSFTQLHEMLPLSSNNEVKQNPSISKQHLRLFDTCSYFASLVSIKQYISTLVLLFYFNFTFTFVLVRLFGHLFSMCYTFQTDDYKTARCNSLEPCFYLEIDTVFYSCIDHGFRYNYLLKFIKRYSRNYEKVILLNLKMFNYVVGQLFFCNNKKYIIIRSLFHKLSIFKTELAVKYF